MPLSETALAELAASVFAEDVGIPLPEALQWSEVEALRYFESGGADRPTSQSESADKSGDVAADTSPQPLLAWWASGGAFVTFPTTAHIAAATSEKVSRVRLLHDTEGVVGEAGDLLAFSGGWDCTVRVWCVRRAAPSIASSTAGELLCELSHEQARWVYDLDTCGYIRHGDRHSIGVLATHTGGWVGEPHQLIRLWSVSRAGQQTAGGGKALG